MEPPTTRRRRSTVIYVDDGEGEGTLQQLVEKEPAGEMQHSDGSLNFLAFPDPLKTEGLNPQNIQPLESHEEKTKHLQSLNQQTNDNPENHLHLQPNNQDQEQNDEEESTFERSQAKHGQDFKYIINPESMLLKKVLKSNGYTIDELEGEIFLNLSEVTIQNENCNERGKLLVTNYRFAFFIGTRLKVDVALGYIERVTSRQDRGGVVIEIHLKHSPIWRFRYDNKSEGEGVDNILELYAFPTKVTDFFAFSHYRGLVKKPDHVNHYIFQKEFSRIGILHNNKFKKLDNFDGNICSTYPNQIIVPCEASEQLIRSVARVRERERIPVATYCVKGNNNISYTLWRSSQLKADESRALNDVEYLKMLSYWSPLVILDARSKHNAKATMENPELYKDCLVDYVNLDPIHMVKTSYYRIIEAYIAGESKKFLKDVVESKWYEQVKYLLVGASVIAEYLLNERNVLVHCGDGWDRTSQLCALAMLIIDPYFRTLDGFATLIEKQFVSFGDPFYLRLGLRGRNEQQIPVFIQFLDCVTQIMHQYPLSFEFSTKYITILLSYIYSNRFGNFLSSSKNEYYEFKLHENTVSIWEQLRKHPLAYNSYYLNTSEIGIYDLPLNLECKSLRFWKEHFFSLTTNLKETYRMHPHAEDNHDYLKLLHDQLKPQTDMLRKKVSEQFKVIMDLKEELAELKAPSGGLEEIE